MERLAELQNRSGERWYWDSGVRISTQLFPSGVLVTVNEGHVIKSVCSRVHWIESPGTVHNITHLSIWHPFLDLNNELEQL